MSIVRLERSGPVVADLGAREGVVTLEASAGGALDATVLVVDDNEANRLLAEETLRDEGYQVVLAGGGEEAMVAFARHAPDCVLLDVAMPSVDGFAVCTRIRASPHGADTPVVFLTARRDVDTLDAALAAGGDDFLTKPVRPAELVIRVRAALKLRRLKTELDEHYLALRTQRDDLLRLHLQKERLMAFVVHDLKNPLSNMDLQVQLVLREKLSPQVTASLQRIRSQARQLNLMVLNLLDVSRGDEGKLVAARAPASLTHLIGGIFGELELAGRQRKVSLRSQLRVNEATLDADLIRRLLTNLIENAIRHAPPGSSVMVSAERREGGVALDVADEGTGVPREKRESIFDPFVQLSADALPPSRAGHGLGLTFCKAVALAHGGSISIEDTPRGALFRVYLPDVS